MTMRRDPGTVYAFGLLVEGLDVEDDAHMDALFRADVDAMVEARGDLALVTVVRSAESAEDALWSSVRDVEGTAPSARVVGIDGDLVNASDIAERIGRTPESVRQLASGTRGPGGFPPVVGIVGKGVRIWRWADVADWFADRGVSVPERGIPAALAVEANARLADRPVRRGARSR